MIDAMPNNALQLTGSPAAELGHLDLYEEVVWIGKWRLKLAAWSSYLWLMNV